MAGNYYLVLGVATDASKDEIKAAYHQCVQAYHPEHYGPDSAPFLAIQEAYQVLGNPEHREAYDCEFEAQTRPRLFGEGGAEPMQARPSAHRFDLGDASLVGDFATHAPSVEDLLGRLFSNFLPGERPKSEHVENLVVDVAITPDQAASGGRIQLLIPTVCECPNCRGRGGVGAYECWRCAGHGALLSERAIKIGFPPGTTRSQVVPVPLNKLGIDNLFLTVRFRVSELAA